MATATVLNPRLYGCLQRAFKYVRISDPGVPARFVYRPDYVYRQGRPKAHVVQYGETYYVSCPFCSDTRQRLAVNHHWADRDEETNDDMLFLATCFNEECLNTRASQKELHALVYPNGKYGRSIDVRAKPAPEPLPPPPVIKLPKKSRLISKLPDDHAAVRYLHDRGFDVGELAKIWGVKYSPADEMCRPRLRSPRIVIPIYRYESSIWGDETGRTATPLTLAGWQARKLCEDSDAPKYLTSRGMRRNEQLYGMPQARDVKGPVVIVEGVTDAWRVGPGALALFGKSISQVQAKLIVRNFLGRPVVVLLDRDAREAATAVRDAVMRVYRQTIGFGVVEIAQVPGGQGDPADCTRPALRKAIRAALD